MLKLYKNISVIIPTLNQEVSIGTAIKDFPSIIHEIVIIDNNSINSTSEVATNMVQQYYLRNEKGTVLHTLPE